MTRFQRAAWLAVLLVTLVAFGVIIPQFPAWGDETIALSADTEVGMATASVTIPAGWDLDIAASSQRQPLASRDGVRVSITDAVWLGDTADLLTHVSRLIFDGDAAIPESPADGGTSREVWRLAPAAGAGEGVPARVDVIRDGQGVVLVIARGTAAAVAAQSEDIDAMSDSVQLDLTTLTVEVSSSLDLELEVSG